MSDLSIYIHWPFCKSKCPYCDFMSVAENDESKYEEIENYLFEDLKNSLAELDNLKIKTVFFGGGTPSLMSPKSIEKILNFIRKNYDTDTEIEITLEANPSTFSLEKMREIKNAGINRLSLGVQSFQDKNLQFLGRIYNSEQALKAAEIVSKIFDNYSFDFIYGYQIQSLDDIENDLNSAMNFGCKHLSCYQLTFEEGTPFFGLLRQGKIIPIKESREIEIFKFVGDFLRNFSLNRYEISNYAISGFESKHNLVYWRYKNYLGIGPSSHSRLIFGNQKFELKKFQTIDRWKSKLRNNESTYEEKNALSEFEQLEEIFIMGLRLSEGIKISDLKNRFPESLLAPVFSKMKQLSSENLFETSQTHIKLSEEGLLKQNSVVEFLFD